MQLAPGLRLGAGGLHFKGRPWVCRAVMVYTAVLFQLLLATFTAGAQHYNLFEYNELDGMRSTLVKAVAKDPNGLVWIGTDGGLIRYNGLEFEHFFDQLPVKFIKDIAPWEGQLLLSSDEGLFMLDPDLHAPAVKELGENGPRLTKKIYIDSHGKLWTSNNGQVYRYSEAVGFEAFAFPARWHSTDFIRSFSIVEDGQGHLFAISQNGGLFRFREEQGAFEGPLQQLPRGVNQAMSLGKGEVWIATYSGVYALYFNPDGTLARTRLLLDEHCISMAKEGGGQVLTAIRNVGVYRLMAGGGAPRFVPLAFEELSFTSASLEENGEIWIGTDNGLALLAPNAFEPVRHQEVYINSIAEYGARVFYAGAGKVFASKSGGRSFGLFADPGFDIYGLLAEEEGLWAMGAGGQVRLLSYDNGAILREADLSGVGKEVYAGARSADGSIWFCQADAPGLARLGIDGSLRTYTAVQGLETANVEYVYFDPGLGVLYAGGQDESRLLFRYNPAADRFENVSAIVGATPDQTFRLVDMESDGHGGLFLGTTLGLFHYWPDSSHMAQLALPETEGMSALAIAPTSDGSIWFANANGLNLLRGGQVHTYTNMHGLPSRQVNWRALHASTAGKLYAGTPDGLACAPSQMPVMASLRPFILNIEASEGVSAADGGRRINKNTGDYLAVKVLSAGYPNMLTSYRAMLESKGGLLERTAENGVFDFSNLPLGKTKVQIFARQSTAHHWSAPLELSVEVWPVWYKAWYGILGVLSVLGLLVVGVNYLRRRHFERKSRRLAEHNAALEARVRSGLQDYQMLVNYIGDSVLKVKQDGAILYVSPSWSANFGYEEGDTIAQSLFPFLHEEDQPPFRAALAALSDAPGKESFETEHRLKARDGSIRWVETKGELAPESEEVVLISRDITERKASEERLAYLYDMQDILMAISSKYINLPLSEVEAAIQQSLEEMGRFVSADRVYIFDYDFEHNSCSNTYEWCGEGITPQIENLQEVPLDELSDWVEAHLAGDNLNYPDVAAIPNPALREVLESQSIKSILAMPLIKGDACIGFVGFDSVSKHHKYTERELRLLQVFGQMLVNIRLRTERQLELRDLLDTTTAQNNRLREFSFLTSHNMRSSVANLLALTEMINLDPGNKEYFQMLDQTVHNLDATVSNINYLLHFEREVNEVEKKPCNILETINGVISLNNQLLRQKGVAVKVDADPSLEVMAIPAHLDSIIHNLLTNAIKYGTTAQEKDLELKAFKEEGCAVLQVKDNGLGIDMERFGQKLFQLGSRLHASSADGQGLGLYMTKNQVVSMGGRIEVESQVGKGAQFTVYFPRPD